MTQTGKTHGTDTVGPEFSRGGFVSHYPDFRALFLFHIKPCLLESPGVTGWDDELETLIPVTAFLLRAQPAGCLPFTPPYQPQAPSDTAPAAATGQPHSAAAV